jgi:hypothetical protein
MTKKSSNLRNVVAIAICLAGVTVLSSCSGGSGSSGKKLASNDILGDFPNLVHQQGIKYDTWNDKYTDALEGDSEAKVEKLREQWDVEVEKYKAEVEKIKSVIVGKTIPVEVEDGLGFEINSCKISNLSAGEKGGGDVYYELEVTVTDVKVTGMSKYDKSIRFQVQYLDKAGNQIGDLGWGHIDVSEIADGATGKSTDNYITIEDAEQFVNFAKLKFVSSK